MTTEKIHAALEEYAKARAARRLKQAEYADFKQRAHAFPAKIEAAEGAEETALDDLRDAIDQSEEYEGA